MDAPDLVDLQRGLKKDHKKSSMFASQLIAANATVHPESASDQSYLGTFRIPYTFFFERAPLFSDPLALRVQLSPSCTARDAIAIVVANINIFLHKNNYSFRLRASELAYSLVPCSKQARAKQGVSTLDQFEQIVGFSQYILKYAPDAIEEILPPESSAGDGADEYDDESTLVERAPNKKGRATKQRCAKMNLAAKGNRSGSPDGDLHTPTTTTTSKNSALDHHYASGCKQSSLFAMQTAHAAGGGRTSVATNPSALTGGAPKSRASQQSSDAENQRMREINDQNASALGGGAKRGRWRANLFGFLTCCSNGV